MRKSIRGSRRLGSLVLGAVTVLAAAVTMVPAATHAATDRVLGHGTLAVARDASGRLTLFGRDGTDRLSVRTQSASDAQTWTEWSSLDGALRSMAAEANQDGSVELFGVNAEGKVWHRRQAGNGWSGWSGLDGTYRSLALGRNADGRLELFGTDTNDQVWHRWQTAAGSTTWSPWARLDGGLRSVAVEANADGRLELFGLNAEGRIWHRWQQTGGWSAWAALDGTLTSLAVARDRTGSLVLIGTNTRDELWQRRQTTAGANNWSSWAALDGSLQSVAADRRGDGRIELVGVNAQGNVWHRWQSDAGGWSAWAALGGDLPPAPPAPPMSNPSNWRATTTADFSNEDWTEEAQGLTTDGVNWYVGSNDSDHRRLYKFGPRFPQGDDRVLGYLALPADAGNHLGPPVWDPVRRRIVVAVEPANVWVVDPETMRTDFIGPLGGDGNRPQGTSIPWVAINPRDGLLYSSAFGRSDQPIKSVDRVNVYDPANAYRWLRSIPLSREIKEVQGGHISAGGHLYLTSNATFDISAYDLANGAYGGRRVVDFDPSDDDEIEGLTLGRYEWDSGAESDVAVLVLDNDIVSDDDVEVRFYNSGSGL
ncbi:tectonin domain-containing protein [Micromonospora sp. RP3T]|uniref:tectonin domain-containing protein n=1 Tax=Micromonospora sp. RP3T TaxID=2135446 RepID=UPI0011B25943|nr:tectonin domain-containing protein [Micromonospora sp. RP3T]